MWSRIAWWGHRRFRRPDRTNQQATVAWLASQEPAAAEREATSERRRLVVEIQTVAPGASGATLMRFDVAALALYRDHLLAANLPRGPEARWERPGDTPAVLMREPMD